MRPSSVLVGASVVIALGLSTCGVANAGEGRSAPTPPPNHRTITDQLNDIESKLDKLLPPTTTTAPPTTTIPVPVPLPLAPQLSSDTRSGRSVHPFRSEKPEWYRKAHHHRVRRI
jgi:hypothetical protein